MEHQSAISYGNKYKNNSFGFDFIIIHESGHEYWGNSVSASDNGDMWIHESFCTYAETLYLEQKDGYAKALKYLISQRKKIQNKHPIQGPYHLAYTGWPDADMYYKGAWMLHSLRNMLDNDTLFLGALKNMAFHFQKKIVDRKQIIAYLNTYTGQNLNGFFAQYLDFAQPPTLDYQIKYTNQNVVVEYRWAAHVSNEFGMPAQIRINKRKYWIKPTKNWQSLMLPLALQNKKNITISATDKFYFLTQFCF